jgi:hypothetical protein
MQSLGTILAHGILPVECLHAHIKVLNANLAHIRTCTCDVHDIGLAISEQRIPSARSYCDVLPPPKSVWLACMHATISTIGIRVCRLETPRSLAWTPWAFHSTALARSWCHMPACRWLAVNRNLMARMSFITCALHQLEATATLFTESVAHIHLASARKSFAPPSAPADTTG